MSFQSTHSVGSGTKVLGISKSTASISIHPLRGEWDKKAIEADGTELISIHPLRGEWDAPINVISSPYFTNFNPPTPWGVGRVLDSVQKRLNRFQSTHSVGSGTVYVYILPYKDKFQSTHSVGSGTLTCLSTYEIKPISIHPLRGEWDFSVLPLL